MKIGDKIKELRKKQDVTQEKLAAYLNISYQAISKWENGMALPDVTLIPQIAHFFGVTADELLGMKDVEASEELKQYEKVYRDNLHQGKIYDNIILSREVNEKYPRNYRWMLNQAMALISYCDTTEHLEYSKEHDFAGEAEKICERVLEDCSVDSIRHSAIHILCCQQPGRGKSELALKYANEMPEMIFCKEFLLANIYEGEDKIRQYQENLLQMIDMCAGRIIHELVYDHMMGKELSVSEKIRFLETSNALYHLILPDDENCMILNLRLWNNYARLAWLWCQAGDADKAMEQLLLAERAATAFDKDRGQEQNYKSALVNRCVWNFNSFGKNTEMSERQNLLRRTNESPFDLVRNREDFLELLKRLNESQQ